MIHLRRGDKRRRVLLTYCGADPTLELAVLKNKHVSCVECIEAVAKEIHDACDRYKAWAKAVGF